jgi:molecular chaperone DnaK (HSP70)
VKTPASAAPSAPATFAVGIDLGTTHSALAHIELAPSSGDELAVSVDEVPQLVAPGEVERRPLLPSFLYLPHGSELPPQALTLPWSGHPTELAVGEIARVLGSKSALRLVSSAKSWLCHGAVDRRAAILPVNAPAEVSKVSPLHASVRYLEHLRQAWDHVHADAPLRAQLVTITVPASFDPAARELTAEAARLAGVGHAVLLEEPQAALYSWLGNGQTQWREQVKPGDVILVLDVGGGTSDFSLIAVAERDGDLELERVAVGDHILLGGDNMDLALAYASKDRLEQQGQRIDSAQLAALTHAARIAKERLLGSAEVASAPVIIAGRSSKLIGGTLRTELSRADLERIVLEGFFPVVDAAARPVARPRVGLTQLGLPYAQDAAITRHLAAFLGRQAAALGRDGQDGRDGPSFARPTAVLFNGGVFRSELLRDRVKSVLDAWLAHTNAPAVRVLSGSDLDLAVARGAAYYGYVRSGHGIRIRGGTAMAYYVGIESAMPAVPGLPPPLNALCVAPFGLEEGSSADMPALELGLVVGEPVRFRFFGSSIRRDDRAGELLEHIDDQELKSLQDVELTMSAAGHAPGDVVIVRLQASVSEVGTLQLQAVARDQAARWNVEFDTREQPHRATA